MGGGRGRGCVPARPVRPAGCGSAPRPSARWERGGAGVRARRSIPLVRAQRGPRRRQGRLPRSLRGRGQPVSHLGRGGADAPSGETRLARAPPRLPRRRSGNQGCRPGGAPREGQRLYRRRPLAVAHRDPHLLPGPLPRPLPGHRPRLPRRSARARIRLSAWPACRSLGGRGRTGRRGLGAACAQRRPADPDRRHHGASARPGCLPVARRRATPRSGRVSSCTARGWDSCSATTTAPGRWSSIPSCSHTRPIWAAGSPTTARRSRSMQPAPPTWPERRRRRTFRSRIPARATRGSGTPS